MASTFDRVMVVGLGTTGARLAVQLAAGGYEVVGVDTNAAAAHSRVRALAGDRQDLLRPPATGQGRGWIDVIGGLDLVRPVDLVIEALPEHLDVKVEVLREADRLCLPDTVFITTTMGLSVTEIAARCGRMTRTVGMQLGDVAAVASDVVELIRTPVTDAGVLDSLYAFVRGLGKQLLTGTDHAGSVGTALSLRYLNRAAAMLEEGYASREDIDTAMTAGCGLPIGPLAQLDLMGLDTVADSMTALARRTGDASWTPAPIFTRMREAGLLGHKSGRGFYSYDTSPEPGSEPVLPLADPLRAVRKVGVVGAGTMATGIAETFAAGGFTTVLVARSDLRAKQARSTVESSLQRRVLRGRLSPAEFVAGIDRLAFESEMDSLGDCDLVVEAVAEDIMVKRDVFGRLDRLARPGAVLATTTSSLPVIECATATGRPWDVVGLHFLNPAPAMKLVEVVHTFLTDKDVVATSVALVTALGKQVVRCGDRTGFIVNALLLPTLNDAATAARSRHLSITEVDRLSTGRLGYPMGPFRLLDMIGIDVAVSILDSLDAAFAGAGHTPAQYLTTLAAGGCLGRKTGRGFYAYDTP